MAIEARCPNGHKIVCPENRAGRSAKCPRCSAPFRIPSLRRAQSNGKLLPEGSSIRKPDERPAEPLDPSAVASPAAQSEASDASTGGEVVPADLSSLDLEDFESLIDALPPGPNEELDTTAAVLAGGSSPSGVSSQSPSDIGATIAAPAEETFLFLCPQGHKLHGPVRLAGKVGKCPHCRARFEIPSPHAEGDEDDADELDDTVTEDPLHDYDDASSDQRLDQEPPSRDVNSIESDEALSEAQDWRQATAAETDDSAAYQEMSGTGDSNPPYDSAHSDRSSIPPPLPDVPFAPRSAHTALHPLAQLLTRLWAEREHGGIVELHLAGGTLLAPEWFDEPASRGAYGLFASQAADGTVTMTAVPWDEVTRVVVRGVVGLPDGMFE